MEDKDSPFVSHTFHIDEFIDVDDAVENTLKNFKDNGLEYVSGPHIVESFDKSVWVNILFKRPAGDSKDRKVNVHRF